MDLFQPLCYGQFVLMENEDLLGRLCGQFDRVVLCSRSQKKLIHQNVVYFQEENDTASQYLIPQAALNYAQHES